MSFNLEGDWWFRTKVTKKYAAPTSFGTMGEGHNVKKLGIRPESGVGSKGSVTVRDVDGYAMMPEPWDSSLCMLHWQRQELLTKVDPNGYVVFVRGMEQLGGNKFLLSDGLFIAKSLNRTLVEYPVKDARIGEADSPLGLGAYWDLSTMCMYHRILDLEAFRSFVDNGQLTADDFVTIQTGKMAQTTAHFTEQWNVQKYFMDYMQYQVIVMDRTWKSKLDHGTMAFLRPNPFYMGVVRAVLSNTKIWMDGNFLAVQWRTETATGNMTSCYEEIRTVIEEQRIALGLTRKQVLVSTDLYGSTSGTFSETRKRKMGADAIRMIKEDYPNGLDNELHSFFNGIQDSGMKAIVSGLVVASSRTLIASSLNHPSTKDTPEACKCQKPYSGYIKLITEWRQHLFRKEASSVIRLYPFGDDEGLVTAQQTKPPGKIAVRLRDNA